MLTICVPFLDSAVVLAKAICQNFFRLRDRAPAATIEYAQRFPRDDVPKPHLLRQLFLKPLTKQRLLLYDGGALIARQAPQQVLQTIAGASHDVLKHFIGPARHPPWALPSFPATLVTPRFLFHYLQFSLAFPRRRPNVTVAETPFQCFRTSFNDLAMDP